MVNNISSKTRMLTHVGQCSCGFEALKSWKNKHYYNLLAKPVAVEQGATNKHVFTYINARKIAVQISARENDKYYQPLVESNHPLLV